MTTTSTIPNDYLNGNPLLYTFRDYHTTIQPYFIIISQFFIHDFSLRLWDRVIYGTWQLPMEFIEVERDAGPVPPSPIEPEYFPRQAPRESFTVSTIFILQEWKKLSLKTKKGKKLPTFDLYDALVDALPLLAHAIWYCYVQSNCGSGDFATTWNCYNLFGYRIYNYIFSSFTAFAFTFISKLILMRNRHRANLPMAYKMKKQSWRRVCSGIIFFFSLTVSTITFLFVGALVLPYLFTNALPMVVIYSFMVAIYAYVVSVVTVLLKGYTFVTRRAAETPGKGFFKRQLVKLHYRPQLVLQAGMRLLPYLVTILFNLSQYFYYGEDYWIAIGREAVSRDPSTYFKQLSDASNIGHLILTSI